MANIYWNKDQKVSEKDIQEHVMAIAEKALHGKTNFGFRTSDGDAELWIETASPRSGDTTYWHIFDGCPKALGWRLMIIKCPLGYIEAFEKSRGFAEIRLIEIPAPTSQDDWAPPDGDWDKID